MNLPELLKLMFFMLVNAVLLFMILAIPLGAEVFFLEKVSQFYTFESPYLIKLFDFQLEVTIGLAFMILLILHTLCFIASFRKESALIKSIRWPFTGEKEIAQLIRNHLFALPLLSSLAYVASKIIHLIQDFYSIPLGEAPLSKDPLIAFLELSISPIIEEFIFRILPIGTFLVTYLISITNITGRSPSPWRTIKFLISVFRDPEENKRALGLKTIKEHCFLSGIELREWLMIVLTSAIFSFSHYASTWDVGKLSSSFIQGLIMGLSYVAYGFQAPIIIHWFLNYHLYTYNLVRVINPNTAILAELNNFFTIMSGISGLIITSLFGVKNIVKVSTNIKAPITRWILGLKNDLKVKGDGALKKVRQVNLKSLVNLNFALLISVLIILIIRLSIINFPSPERGERYYETGLIFDEAYYVKAARSLLRGESVNNEHPPLAKLFISIGILIFGDNPVGWRLPMIFFSSLSIILLYMLALKITKNRLASLFTSILFMLDIMAFNIGQIAILDPPSLMFILIACITLIRGRRDLSGAFFGLALLCKLSSLFSLGILLFLLLRMMAENDRSKLRSLFGWIYLSIRVFLVAFTIFLLGIWIYDAIYGVYGGNPLNHLSYMLSYHSALTYKCSEGIILPLRWINPLNPFSPIPYYVVTARELLEGGILREYHPIAYYGLYSPLWWSIWLIAPLSLKKMIKDRDASSAFIFTWITANFLPYVILAYVLHRWVYPFYFCMTLPGLYMGLSHYLTSLRRLKILLALLTLIQALWFIIWFPVKPKPLIDFLSSLNLPT